MAHSSTVHADHAWRTKLGAIILGVDALAITGAVAVSHLAWLWRSASGEVAVGQRTLPEPGIACLWLSLLLVTSWMLLLGLNGSRRWRVLGEGVDEYKFVLRGSVLLGGLLAALSFLSRVEIARGYLILVLSLGSCALLTGRWTTRRWLHRQRRQGRMVSRVLVIGQEVDSASLVEHLRRCPEAGLDVAGVLSEIDDVERIVQYASVEHVGAVVVCQSLPVQPHVLNVLRWQLEAVGTDLIIAPSFSGIAGERVHARPIDGVPLFYVEGARYAGGMRVAKAIVDPLLALGALILLAPIMLVVGALIWLSDHGPIFYRQVRIGQEGRTFRIWKFRSMRQDADIELMARLRAQGTAETPMFKVTDDDRVTPMGRYLRKWSLDELPQLFNVLSGDMSMVGPRPQRPQEVALYSGHEHRRLISKPGITGLWQVSGRSDLSWDEALVLDLYYVENWSVALDTMLLLKTIGAVFRGRGAR